MAGDSYNVRLASGWNSTSTPSNNTAPVLADLFNLLSAGVATTSGGKASYADLQNSNSGLNSGLSGFLGSQTSSGLAPKAYLNWVLLDEQFHVAKDAGGNIIGSGYSGFDQVGASGTTKIHVQTLTVAKSGYLYIYTSNEATNIDVYFDNLQVTHNRGQILEETHYYPGGLIMNGISSKAAGFLENKSKFNGKEAESREFADGAGLDYYDFGARNYDPQIMRWFNQDKYAKVYLALNPYQYAANNPIKIIDEAGHLLKDKDGNIIATPTGNTYSRTDAVQVIDGAYYRTTSTYNEVVVYTDQGTPVRALQLVNQYVEQKDENGNYVPASNNAPVDCAQNCHGTTFAEGKLVIVDQSHGSQSVKTILKEDGYEPTSDVDKAKIFVQGDNNIIHSGIVNQDGTVTVDNDMAKPKASTISNEKNKQDPDVAFNLYKRNGSDKQVSTEAGTVKNGVRLVSQQEATDIRKANGLKTTNNAVGVVSTGFTYKKTEKK